MLEQCPIVRVERGCWWLAPSHEFPVLTLQLTLGNLFAFPASLAFSWRVFVAFLLIRVLGVLICVVICTSSSQIINSQEIARVWEIIKKGPETLNIVFKGVLCRRERRLIPLCSQLLHGTSFKYRVINSVSGRFFSKSSLKAWWGVCPLPWNSGRILTFYHQAIINDGF